MRAHPSRQALVDALLDRLGLGAEHVVWDRGNDSWATGARAWEAHDPDADWHLVIEDDAIVCRDLLVGLEQALDHVPTESVVSLYLGNKTASREVANAAAAADSRICQWIRASTLVWGVAIAAPVVSIEPMLGWCHRQKRYPSRVYDTRIARYYAEVLNWPAYYTWPSLVDHGQEPSLLGHGPGRQAIAFIGATASAAAIDWSRPAGPRRAAFTHSEGATEMPYKDSGLVVPRNNAVVEHEGRRVVLRRGETVAEAGAGIVTDHEGLWEPLTVHYPAEQRSSSRRNPRRPVEQTTAAPGEQRDVDVDTRAVREWAQANGYDVSDRGRVPADVVEAYKQAQE